MDALITGTSVVPSSGGMAKTMRKFCEVFDGRIISFTSRTLPDSERSSFEEVIHVPTSNSRILDWYGWAPRKNRIEVELLAAQANLLTCHNMLRYHAQWVRKMSIRNRVPYWFIAHGQLDPWVYTYRSSIKKLWLFWFGRRMLTDAQYVIFATKQEKRKAGWFYRGPNTRVIHWPVELTDISGKGEARRKICLQYGISENSRILLFFGRLHSVKRPIETIQLLSALGDPNLHLLIVGPDEDVCAADCQEEIERLGLGRQVHLIGPVYGAKKNTLFLGSDAFISLSYKENFGHTAAEALAAGTPVILSPGNDLAPELKPYHCGWMLGESSPFVAVSALQEFMVSDREKLYEMGARGRRFIANECNPADFSKTLKELAFNSEKV